MGSPYDRIIPVLVPDSEDEVRVVYYIQGGVLPDYRMIAPRVVGKATWGKPGAENPRNLALDFFGEDSYINTTRLERCIYLHVAQHEPLARGWEQLLGTQTVSPGVYSERTSPSFPGSTPNVTMT
jgi:hypothetical protein